DAQRSGLLDWFGYVPNRHALRMAEGALAGLSLLHDVPAHRDVLPAKVIEYLARGVPVISTPLPRTIEALRGNGVIVPFGDPEAAAQAVLDLKADPARRAAMSAQGHAEARARYHWPDRAGAFVAHLEAWAGAPSMVATRSPRRAVPA
ncbi:MAG TPA: glycosyltransferase, partial [Trebonia sp.]